MPCGNSFFFEIEQRSADRKVLRYGQAMRWGFEGWTQVQFDIGADGNVINQRALLSYPPFIFSEAGTKFFTQAKYAKTYRPDGGLGCGATTTRIRFLLPESAHRTS